MDTIAQPTLIRAALFIVLGASGTFLLLPHRLGRARPLVAHLVGYALVGIALAFFASFWRPAGPFLSRAFFTLFGIAAVFGSILTIASKNPVHSALWFASVVLATAGLFLLAGAQFLAAGTVIVYAGAIIVTFLFVIMLAQMEGRATYDRMARSPFLATFSSFFLLFGLIYSLLAVKGPAPGTAVPAGTIATGYGARPASAVERLRYPNRLTTGQKVVLERSVPPTSMLPSVTGDGGASGRHVAGLGSALYTEHLITVELTGALLFAALIGALAIATPKAPIRPTTHPAAPNA